MLQQYRILMEFYQTNILLFRNTFNMDYKQFLYVGWLICAMYISYYHGILSVFTSNQPMDNQLFVSDVWLDLILRSLFRLAVPAYMLYNMLYPPPRPDVELQNLHKD